MQLAAVTCRSTSIHERVLIALQSAAKPCPLRNAGPSQHALQKLLFQPATTTRTQVGRCELEKGCMQCTESIGRRAAYAAVLMWPEEAPGVVDIATECVQPPAVFQLGCADQNRCPSHNLHERPGGSVRVVRIVPGLERNGPIKRRLLFTGTRTACINTSLHALPYGRQISTARSPI